MSQEAPQPPRVKITFSPLEGCTLKAVRLAGNIRRCFEIPVKVVQTNNGFFDVTVNGVSIYRREGLCDIRESEEPIFMALARYKEPVRNLPADGPDEDLERDPRHRAWLRSMCSGE